MQIVGCADDHRVEVFLFLEQFAEIDIGGATVILAGTLLRGVIGFNDFLARFASGNAAGYAERMRQLNRLIRAKPIPAAIDAQQFAHGIAEFMSIPLGMIGAAFVDVADGHALHVGLAQKVKHDAQALGADANERNVHLVAGRDIARATEHAARNNGKSERGCGDLSEKFAPRNRSVQRAMLNLIFHGSSRSTANNDDAIPGNRQCCSASPT